MGERTWTIGGDDPADRLIAAVRREAWRGGQPPSPDQIAMVLHALADHTSLMQALDWSREPGGDWPAATSVGRWLHAYGDYIESGGRNYRQP